MLFTFDMPAPHTGEAEVDTYGDTASLKYIFIDEAYRDNGYSVDFLTDIMFYLYDSGYRRFCMDIIESRNPKLMSAARRLGMEIAPLDTYYFRFRLGDIQDVKAASGANKDIISFGRLTASQLSHIREKIGSSANRPMENPVDSASIERELSVCHINGGKVDGAILIDRIEELLYISFVWVDSADTLAFKRMLYNVLIGAKGGYAADTEVEFSVSEKKLAAYIKKEFGVDGEPMYEAGYDIAKLGLYYEEDI